MAGRGQSAFIAALMAGFLAATTAAAETVPLPRAVPLPKTGVTPSPSSVPRPPAPVEQPADTPVGITGIVAYDGQTLDPFFYQAVNKGFRCSGS